MPNTSMLLGLIALHSLATWRLTSLLYSERGPFDAFTKIRELAGIGHIDYEPIYPIPSTFFSGLLECFACLSMWASILLLPLLIPSLGGPHLFLLWLAGSAGAILIQEVRLWLGR